MAITAVTLYAFIAIASLLVYLYKRQYSYWADRGIPHDKPAFIFGNLKELQKTKNFSEIFSETYKKFKGTGPFAGFYFMFKPAVFVLDLELAKNILIKDFSSFDDRGLFHNQKDDPLTGNLFSLDGPTWRKLRTKLTPTFTSGKMRLMFPMIVSIGKELTNVMGEQSDENPVVEIRNIVERFTIDVIGTCAFGIECNSLRDPTARFGVIGRKAFTEQRHNKIVNGFLQSFPNLASKLRMRMVVDEVHDFYMRLVQDTVEYREKNNIKRNDFMGLLIELKNNQSIKSDDSEQLTALTLNDIAAQAFLFFLAGFETSSTTMGFCLYELAQNHAIQDRVRKEINDVLARHNGDLTYESMKEMQYLDQTICETLRKYAVLSQLTRRCNRDYETSDPRYYIKKDSIIIIPVDAIHHDPEYYPNPEVFDPDRFTQEEIEKRHPLAWLPFGEGPRNCIGLRFGKMQTLIGLAFLLKNYKFTTTEKTPIPIKFDVNNILLSSASGIYLKVERI